MLNIFFSKVNILYMMKKGLVLILIVYFYHEYGRKMYEQKIKK